MTIFILFDYIPQGVFSFLLIVTVLTYWIHSELLGLKVTFHKRGLIAPHFIGIIVAAA